MTGLRGLGLLGRGLLGLSLTGLLGLLGGERSPPPPLGVGLQDSPAPYLTTSPSSYLRHISIVSLFDAVVVNLRLKGKENETQNVVAIGRRCFWLTVEKTSTSATSN